MSRMLRGALALVGTGLWLGAAWAEGYRVPRGATLAVFVVAPEVDLQVSGLSPQGGLILLPAEPTRTQLAAAFARGAEVAPPSWARGRDPFRSFDTRQTRLIEAGVLPLDPEADVILYQRLEDIGTDRVGALGVVLRQGGRGPGQDWLRAKLAGPRADLIPEAPAQPSAAPPEGPFGQDA